MEDGERAVLLGVVERQALLQVGVRKGQLSQPEPVGPQRVVGLQQARRVVSLLRQLQTLLPQLARRLVRPTPVIELPESRRTEKSWGVSPTRWQRARARA
jgi:hypothetical protein